MQLSGLSLRDLEYVVAVAEHRHFRQAAEACGVSQPSLSSQIRRLEERLDLEIFERAGRRVLITPRGEVVVSQARKVLNEARRLIELAQAGSQPLAGPLRLGAIATLGPYLFPRVLRPIRERYPEAELILKETQTDRLIAELRQGAVDLALLAEPVEAEDLERAPILFERFYLIHPPGAAIAKSAELKLEGLPSEGLILLEEGHCLRDQAMSLCQRQPGGQANRHATGLETLRHMVAAGEGWSIMPALAIPPGAAEARDPLGGLVTYTPLSRPEAGREIVLAWRRSSTRSAEYRAFAALLAETLSPAAGDGANEATRQRGIASAGRLA